ncbi:hypothetical protein K7432_013027 [Basidiobolus ranarum]|uniref:Arrestin C-terminal-like domain-containing protein n=1 Tax=Basidiobolus ranarum TaxID=34480 RepID=A0ABR2WK13_9FUNG
MFKRVRRDSAGLLNEEGLDIELHHDVLTMQGSPRESVGCVLSGALKFNLIEPLKVKSITLKFVGKVKIDGCAELSRQEFELIQHKWSFLEAQQDNYLLAPNNYNYHFELPLPGNLPESVEVNNGKIFYQLIAVVERPAFRFDIKKVKDVDIKRTPLASIDDGFQPVMASGVWSDKLAYTISIPDTKYTIGDTFPVMYSFCLLDPTLKIRKISLLLREFIYYNLDEAEPVSKWSDLRGMNQMCPSEYAHAWEGRMDLQIPKHAYYDCESKYIRVFHKFFVEIELSEDNGSTRVLNVLLRVGIQSAIQNELSQSPPRYQPFIDPSGVSPPPYSHIACA